MSLKNRQVRCPQCMKHGEVIVTSTRIIKGPTIEGDRTQRRKKCRLCDHRWVTFEMHKNQHDFFTKAVRRALEDAKKKQAKPQKHADRREELLKTVREIEGRDR